MLIYEIVQDRVEIGYEKDVRLSIKEIIYWIHVDKKTLLKQIVSLKDNFVPSCLYLIRYLEDGLV